MADNGVFFLHIVSTDPEPSSGSVKCIHRFDLYNLEVAQAIKFFFIVYKCKKKFSPINLLK